MMRYFTVLAILVLVLTSVAAWSQNLITNGGFENGDLSRWTSWSATWTTGASAVAESTDKVEGNYAAALSCTQGSFGIYKQIAVTPGATYKVSGSWKGTYSGGSNWFEVLLIDGAFDINQADNSTYCTKNYIAAYDPASSTFDWQPISTAYSTTPYIQNGMRTATGNMMTLVLKTGGFGNPTGYFDNMQLVVVPEPSSLAGFIGGAAGMVFMLKKRI